ncbi:hypothetical protein EMIT0P294_120154 [Pseudomonas sp. IT-P294]
MLSMGSMLAGHVMEGNISTPTAAMGNMREWMDFMMATPGLHGTQSLIHLDFLLNAQVLD